MCGIAGEIRFDGKPGSRAIVKAMCDEQIHRGPDDDGYYATGPVGLGIRRLAIIDLTKGLYPLHNEGHTIHLVFNGEIYGFDALRAELEAHGHHFHSKTDAETVVHSYEQWGTASIDRLNGMFAFALWDEKKQLLWLARDHFGIKPLYYQKNANSIVFASEIKPLLVHPDVHRRPNEQVISAYIKGGRVDDTENTFFEGIKQLRPAHQMIIRPNGSVELTKYWAPSISRKMEGATSVEEVATTRRLFLDAIRRQLVSDVPVGTCLSGGIDSSSVVSAIRRVHPKGAVSTGEWIKTFSAIFPGYSVDESEYVKTVCDAEQAEPNPIQPTASEFWKDMPELIRCQEEPFGSTSIYAQYRVMKKARERGVTVLLDGQGGDELLCGYVPLYLHYLLTLRKQGHYRALLVEGARSYNLMAPTVRAYLLGYVRRLLRHGKALFSNSTRAALKQAAGVPADDLPRLLELITVGNGLPALLRYEDKNAMWHSIEARVPFLDRPFFEYVAALPLGRKLHNGWTKHVFRCAMKGILPEKIRLRRSKIGFETPETVWFNGELRRPLQEFFADPNLVASRFYNVTTVSKLLAKPEISDNEVRSIWRAVNLELWYHEFFGDKP